MVASTARTARASGSSSSNTMTALKCLSAVGASIPFPGIAPAIAIVSSIMEIVESIRTAKKDCKALAEKAAQFVLALHKETESLDATSPTYHRIQANIDPFKSILEEIQALATKLSRSTRVKLMLKRDFFLERISELSSQLDTCYQSFQIGSLAHMQKSLHALSDAQVSGEQRIQQRLGAVRKDTLNAQGQGVIHLTAEIRAIERNLVATLKSDINATQQILYQVADDIKSSVKTVKSESSSVIALCEVEPLYEHIPMSKHHGGVTAAKYRNKDVLVKRFRDAKNFVQEVNMWKDIWHPYLPQLVGHSSESVKFPFVVLDARDSPYSMHSYLLTALESGPASGLMAGLEMVYRISSAVSHLHQLDLLSKEELAKCLESSEITLTNHTGVMLGGSLLSCANIRPAVPIPHRDETRQEFLADRFFALMLQLCCPNRRYSTIDVNSTRSATSVLLLLLQFAAFGPKGRTLEQIRRKISHAWEALSRQNHLKSAGLPFSAIRQCLLEIDDLTHYRSHVPRPHWRVRTGDVAYVKDDEFVVIANVLDDPNLGFDASHDEIRTVMCDPHRPYGITDLGDGWTRYEFDSPALVTFWHAHRYVIDDRLAMRHLLEHANRYLEQAGLSGVIKPSDLILVVNRETKPRHSGFFDFTPKEGVDQEPPEKVHFFECNTGIQPGRQWGYWSLSPELAYIPAGTQSDIKDPRVRSSCLIDKFTDVFNFIKLEEEDFVTELGKTMT